MLSIRTTRAYHPHNWCLPSAQLVLDLNTSDKNEIKDSL